MDKVMGIHMDEIFLVKLEAAAGNKWIASFNFSFDASDSRLRAFWTTKELMTQLQKHPNGKYVYRYSTKEIT